jgi:hypothetical protein
MVPEIAFMRILNYGSTCLGKSKMDCEYRQIHAKTFAIVFLDYSVVMDKGDGIVRWV